MGTPMRDTRTVRAVIGGCFTCWGSDARWDGPNAQGLAAQHHDRTGHPTWADVSLSVYYGREPK